VPAQSIDEVLRRNFGAANGDTEDENQGKTAE